MSDEGREDARRDEREREGATHDESPSRPHGADEEDAPAPLPLPGRVRPPGASLPLPGEGRPPLPRTPQDEPLRPADLGTIPLPRAPRTSGEEDAERVPLPGPPRRTEPEPGALDEPLRAPARWVQRPAETPPPGPSAARPSAAPEPARDRPSGPPPPAAHEPARERPSGSPPPAAPESPPPIPPRPVRPARELDVAGLAAAARERVDEDERSYRSLVEDVEQYLEDGYDLFGLVGYPRSGKSHALQALSKVMHGFDADARARFREALAPGQTEKWLFYYAYDDGRRKWVFVDVGGELYDLLHSNDWKTATDASAGLLHTVAHCRALLLMLHPQAGHLRYGAKGFKPKMSEAERETERKRQKAQEEIEFFDEFLLFARALRAERGNLDALLKQAASAPLAETLRAYQGSPRLELPVAVLFTQADRLLDRKDFGAGRDEYVHPLTIHGVAPFVGRHMPGLLGSLLRHARRFRLDFAQSYVEGEGPGDADPIWEHENEPLSVGLLPAVEFLERSLTSRGLETRTALRLHRLLHPRQWRDVEVEL